MSAPSLPGASKSGAPDLVPPKVWSAALFCPQIISRAPLGPEWMGTGREDQYDPTPIDLLGRPGSPPLERVPDHSGGGPTALSTWALSTTARCISAWCSSGCWFGAIGVRT